jgi:hypothetical protein
LWLVAAFVSALVTRQSVLAVLLLLLLVLQGADLQWLR